MQTLALIGQSLILIGALLGLLGEAIRPTKVTTISDLIERYSK